MGWLALGVIVNFCSRPGLLAKIVAFNVFFVTFIVIGALIPGVLAFYSILNTWRRLRRGVSAASGE